MRKIWIGLIVFIITACSKKAHESDIVCTDYKQGAKLELTGPFAVKSLPFDVNTDGEPDYLIDLRKIKKDGTYYHEDAFYITIQRSLSYLGRPNPYTPVLLHDTVPVAVVNSPAFAFMAKLYAYGEGLDTDTNNLFEKLLLSKQDQVSAIRPSGDKYLPVVMEKGGNGYYGWMHLYFEDNSVTVKGTAFCTTANKKINMGQRK